MAEEDLIFGKNRHMFGGIEPSNMKKFSSSVMGGKINLVCQLPSDTVIDGQTLCSVAGAVIRRKTTGYPVDEFDGDLIADITSDLTVQDPNVELGNAYYYAAFPYSKQGVYNRSKNDRTMCDFGADHYIFGYDLNLADENPATRVTYPSDVLNYGFTPAKMNFSKGTFDYGSWPDTPGNNFLPRPCILSYAGTVLQYLDPNDYTKKYNSTETSDVSNPDSGGNAMMEWPKIYIHREVVNGVYKFRCSDLKFEDDWDCWCNYDVNNNIIDHFYTSIYPGVRAVDGTHTDRLRSISGYSIDNPTDSIITESSITSATIATYYDWYAKGNKPNRSTNGGWNVELLADRLLIQDLLVLMAKTTNCQEAYGMGTTSTLMADKNGELDKKGIFWGSSGVGYAVKVFGMENWWANRHRFMLGLCAMSKYYFKYYLRIKITHGTHDGSTGNDFYSDLSKYITVGLDEAQSKNVLLNQEGFISNIHFDSPFGRTLPNAGKYGLTTDVTGSSSTYETDYVKTIMSAPNVSSDEYHYVAYVGYSSKDTDYSSGPFCLYLENKATFMSGNTTNDINIDRTRTCAALTYKG